VDELSAVVMLLALGAAYARGVTQAWGSAGHGRLVRVWQARTFVAAEAVLAVALLPPLSTRAHDSLTAHMVQHVLLIVVVAPLLALAAPLPTLLWALPEAWRDRALPAWRAALRSHSRRWGTWVTVALVAQGAVMLAWHAPGLYDAALHHDVLHVLEHASYLVTATIFSWAVGVGSTRRHGAAVPVLFVAALPGTALGAALTLGGTPWYARYPSMADQQLAGVVMWGFAGLAYVLAAACLFGLWLAGLERETPSRPVEPPVRALAARGGPR
jgi:cytochrome c oxidase assembly factor CtaG